MSLNSVSNSIEVDLSKVESSETYMLEVVLTDSTGKSSTYT